MNTCNERFGLNVLRLCTNEETRGNDGWCWPEGDNTFRLAVLIDRRDGTIATGIQSIRRYCCEKCLPGRSSAIVRKRYSNWRFGFIRCDRSPVRWHDSLKFCLVRAIDVEISLTHLLYKYPIARFTVRAIITTSAGVEVGSVPFERNSVNFSIRFIINTN